MTCGGKVSQLFHVEKKDKNNYFSLVTDIEKLSEKTIGRWL